MEPTNVGEKIRVKTWENAPKRPLFLFIVAIGFIIEPLIKLISIKLSSNLDFLEILKFAHGDSLKRIFEFWFLFPLGGFALLKARRFTFFLFIFVQIYSIVTFVSIQRAYDLEFGFTPTVNLVLLILFNLLILMFITRSETRKPFFHKRWRIWEFAPRFAITIPCKLVKKNQSSEEEIEYSEIKNISSTGAFIHSSNHPLVSETISISFDFYNFHFDLTGKVVHNTDVDGYEGFGVNWEFENYFANREFRRFIKALDILKG